MFQFYKGRRRSRAISLRLYSFLTIAAATLSVIVLAGGDLTLEITMSESGSSSRAAPAPKRKTPKNALGAREDVTWEHGIAVDSNPRIIKCEYCEKVMSGGVYRLKHHLARTNKDVGACRVVPDDVKSKMMEIVCTLQERLFKKCKKKMYFKKQAQIPLNPKRIC
ncbi:hypothetical protein MLD38_021426 [Melastoma candidum]|uniref:Uncharacterized protein n=1 Tax=Melastoma candidum TaxID=119954 RepID=A0ACB9QHW7_9MYRT|nr:hypothetical protein MLD38_021426 [Melastoma candidum]